MEQFLGIVIPLIMISISGYIIWRSTNKFEAAADTLGQNLSKGVKGATLNAIASSMPEFLTTLIFLFYFKDLDGFSGGIGVAAGSALFNLLIIPPVALLAIGGLRKSVKIDVDKSVIIRDGAALIISNIILIFIIKSGELHWYHGAMLVSIYLIYLIFLFSNMKRKNKIGKDGSCGDSSTPKKHIKIGRDVKLKLWTEIIISVVIMSFGTWILVLGTELIGRDTYTLYGVDMKGLNIPLLFASLILAATASSIPDLFLSIKDARKGKFDDSISNALGSNIFDISFALGLPLCIYTLVESSPIIMSAEASNQAEILWIILLVVNSIAVPTLLIKHGVGKSKALILILLYIAFILLIFSRALI